MITRKWQCKDKGDGEKTMSYTPLKTLAQVPYQLPFSLAFPTI
jgi:hypothetical protein